MTIRTWSLALVVLSCGASVASARQLPEPPARVWLSGWAGLFTSVGGFSHGADEFYQFDDGEFAFGGALHVDTRLGLLVGVEALYTKPGYTRFDRVNAVELNKGDASALAALLSARLSSGGGPVGLYLGGGIGLFHWDVPDLPDTNRDLALNANIGVEVSVFRRTPLFAEYGTWWVYHEEEEVESNTARHNLLRVGVRAGLF